MGDPGEVAASRGLADTGKGADMADATCSIDGCDNEAHARSWCNKHYLRWQAHGDVNHVSPLMGRRSHAGRTCAVEGCDEPRRKRDWCSGHYTHWRRHGDAKAPYAYRWADEKRCVVCGASGWDGPRRKFCSGACQQMYQRHGTSRPASVPCVLCVSEIDLTTRSETGRIKRTDTLLCHRCKRRRGLRHKTSVSVIENRDGTDCGICCEPVNMGLVHPDPMSASLDHIVPRARGGSDHPSNLQLAHLTCNLKKHTR